MQSNNDIKTAVLCTHIFGINQFRKSKDGIINSTISKFMMGNEDE